MTQRGLAIAPKIAVGYRALEVWAALRKGFPGTQEPRYWVHKTANILNEMPKNVHSRAERDLHKNWQAETKEDANKAFDAFIEKFGAKYATVCECLAKDQDVLLTFYEFPVEHGINLQPKILSNQRSRQSGCINAKLKAAALDARA